MLEFYKQKRWWSVLQSPIVIIILLILVFVLGKEVYERYTIEREMAGRRVEVERRLGELKERRDVLKEKVEYLSHERGIEAEMRRNFDVVQEGEKVVIILDDENESRIEPLSPPAPLKKSPWYIFWR
ncbi:MAG: septum formation initiator family protein [Candidatus Paceibacteria bacterium]